MLYKYEKNVEHLQLFDKKGRNLLSSLIPLEPKENLAEIETIYTELSTIGIKLDKLKDN